MPSVVRREKVFRPERTGLAFDRSVGGRLQPGVIAVRYDSFPVRLRNEIQNGKKVQFRQRSRDTKRRPYERFCESMRPHLNTRPDE